MIDLITGHQGMPHISAKQISDLNNAMMEGYGADKVMRMKDGTITLTNNDVFTVNPGYWRVNGYDMEIQQTETIQIVRPTGNLKRYDDIYIEILRDIPSGAERAEIVKVEGSPATSNPSHPPVPTEPELTTDVLLLCIQVGYVYATSTYTTKHDDTIPYHYVSETEYTELLTHLLHEQYSRVRMSSGNFAPIRVDDIIKLNTKGTWTHTDPAHPGAYSNDTYTLYSGNIVFQISSNELGLKSILVTTSSTSGYSEKLILFKGEVGIGTDNLWLPRNGSQVRSGFSATAIVNGEEYSVGTGGFYVELPSGVLTELYIQATSGISENISFYPTIRYKDDPTYTSSYPPAPTNIMLWNEINDVKKDLLSDMSDKAPYLFRKSKGDMVDLELVGYSVAVNQLIPTSWCSTGGVFTNNGDGSYTVNGTASSDYFPTRTIAIAIKANHKYLLSTGVTSDAKNIFIGINGLGNANYIKTAGVKYSSTDSFVFMFAQAGTYSNDKVYPTCIDLTQKFGTDIADYIYTKEQASAGSGIAWIKSFGFFSKLYEPYNLGSIQSVKPIGRKITGKNLLELYGSTSTYYGVSTYVFNGEIEFSGTCTGTPYTIEIGEAKTNAQKITLSWDNTQEDTFNYRYRLKAMNGATVVYTSSDIWLSYEAYHEYDLSNYAFDKLIIQMVIANNTVTKGKVKPMLRLAEIRDDTFEPYQSETYPISTELRGILLRDGENLYGYGDTDDGSGTSNVRYKIVNLGDYNWGYVANENRFYTTGITDIVSYGYSELAQIVCSKYVTSIWNRSTDKTIFSAAKAVCIKDSNYTDATLLKAALDGVYLVYPLAEPITESSTPWQNPQRVFTDGTEQFIDDRDVPIPVGNVSKYTSSDIMPPVQDYVDGAIKANVHTDILWELPKDFDYTNLPYNIQLSGDLSQYDYIQAVICHSLYDNEIEGGMEIITFKDTGADTGNIFETAIENSFIDYTSYVTKTTRYRGFSYSYGSKIFGINNECYKIAHKYTKTNPVETLEDFIIYNGSSYYYMLYPIKIIGYKY